MRTPTITKYKLLAERKQRELQKVKSEIEPKIDELAEKLYVAEDECNKYYWELYEQCKKEGYCMACETTIELCHCGPAMAQTLQPKNKPVK